MTDKLPVRHISTTVFFEAVIQGRSWDGYEVETMIQFESKPTHEDIMNAATTDFETVTKYKLLEHVMQTLEVLPAPSIDNKEGEK